MFNDAATEDVATEDASLADALETELALADDAPIDTVTEDVAPVDLPADSSDTTDDAMTSVTDHHVPPMASDDSVTAVLLEEDEPAVEMDDESVRTADSGTETVSSPASESHDAESMDGISTSVFAALSSLTTSSSLSSSRRRTRGKRYSRANVKINARNHRPFQWRRRRNADATKAANDDKQNPLPMQQSAVVDTQVKSLNDSEGACVTRLPPLSTRSTPVVDDDTIPQAKAKSASLVVDSLNPTAAAHPPQSCATSASSFDDEMPEKANAKLRFWRVKKAKPKAPVVHDREDKGPSFLSILSAALSSTPLFI